MKNILNSDERWSLFCKITGIVTNAAFLLSIAKFLSANDAAVWFLFSAIFSIASIGEGGFAQTISRHIVYIRCKKSSHANFSTDQFIGANNVMFMKIVTCIALASLIGGAVYFYLSGRITLSSNGYVAWAIYVASATLSLLSSQYTAIIVGFGKVALTQKIQSFVYGFNFGAIVASIIVMKNISIITLAIVNLLTQYLSLVLSLKYARQNYKVVHVNHDGMLHARKIVLKDMKQMIVNLIAYNVLTSVFYIILANCMANSVLASFGLTTRIFSYLSGISSILLVSNSPHFASLFGSQKINQLNAVFRKKAIATFFLYAFGSFLVVMFFGFLQHAFRLKTNIFGQNLLVCFLFFSAIEFLVSIVGNYLIACNELRMMPVSFVASAIILILAYVLGKLSVSLDLIFAVRGFVSVAILLVPSLYLVRMINSKRDMVSFSEEKL